MPSEFDLIARYFTRPARSAVLGVGDDCALLAPTPGLELAISTDMLVENTHFLPDADPEALGWKVLAVNVSDIAAMGARPRWATLAAALPDADPTWLEGFARGFFACAEEFGIDLIGGDTTRGPRSFCVSILGEVKPGQALRRDGAHAGDDVWISGHPGRAALGLAHLQGRIALAEPARSDCLEALNRPQPRVALGLALCGTATAAIDVSDGVLADLGHILESSSLAARLEVALPPDAAGRNAWLAGGDDYELVFTAPPARREDIGALSSRLGFPLTRIGSAIAGIPGSITVFDELGREIACPSRGYDHFA